MLTAKQSELIRFIRSSTASKGYGPSYREMAQALDLRSTSGVHRLVSGLEDRGFIARLPGRARSIQIIRGGVQ